MALSTQQLQKMAETLVKQRLQESLKSVFQGVGEMAKTMADTPGEQSQVRLDLLQIIESSFTELIGEQKKRARVKVG